MENDFLERMGYAALSSRLKRLSDALLYSTNQFYKQQGLDVEPSWRMIIILLREKSPMTVSQLSLETKLSHPAVVQLTNKMKAKGYLKSSADPQDGRRSLLELTTKAEEVLPLLQKCWKACNMTMKELTKGKTLIFEVLKDMETQMEAADYKTRTIKNMNEKL
ncbi:MarR family winged helix-turn-helix transcriptional regulator [Sinomicrobium soli]|uniref:MarR family winged helix-turn-helix transcriptional regulator n=1 Tax=Sinomicrobium sp. N-1-3-6 TaxID=2219864 RepID=UPI000DCC84DB|nr:helix-turn-helix domain-containing protein [Sinomicrobium sp. N-1-3-6]RAV27775.1 MarR family transcriptional regulator [Sinomicrobium sp. N-1-3-6]